MIVNSKINMDTIVILLQSISIKVFVIFVLMYIRNVFLYF